MAMTVLVLTHLMAGCGGDPGDDTSEISEELKGVFRLQADHSDKCLDVTDASKQDKATVLQQQCGPGQNQQWRLKQIDGDIHQIVAAHSGKCLDVEDDSKANGARIIQFR